MTDPSPSDPTSAPRTRALIVARRSSMRSGLLRAMRTAGFAVRTAEDPHGGVASFVERPTDVVIVSVEAWTSRDLGFLRELRRRDPSTRILLLVPEGRRKLARRALQVGADSWTPEPYYPEEVVLLASSLVRPRGRKASGGDAAVENTAYWVKHLVGNVATILGLDPEHTTPDQLRSQVRRLDTMLKDLSPVAFPDPSPPERLDLGELTEAAVARAPGATPARQALASGIRVHAPRRQVEHALDALVACLVGLGRDAALSRGESDPDPVDVDLSVDRREASRGRPEARTRLRLPGVHIEPERARMLRDSPLWVGEFTRESHGGLFLVERLAREHQGHTLFRPTTRGTLLGFALPEA